MEVEHKERLSFILTSSNPESRLWNVQKAVLILGGVASFAVSSEVPNDTLYSCRIRIERASPGSPLELRVTWVGSDVPTVGLMGRPPSSAGISALTW